MNSSLQSLYFLGFILAFEVAHSIQGQERDESKKTGTAFVVSSDGYLLTCMHVVADAAKVEVAIGGKSYQATVLALNEKTDLALLRIAAKGLTALPLADSGAVEVGEEAHAFGFPLASVLGDSVKVTRGTVSGIETKEGHTVLQIDATINQGNSGGPVVNEKGEVVGVINARLAGSVVSSVGLAIPVNYAKTLLRENEVKFGTEGAKTKLDGPMLVKRVSPALALVTVTPNILTHAESVSSVAFSPDGRSLVSADTSGRLKVWNVQTRECTRALEGHVNARVTSIAFSIGGKMLAGVGYFNDKTVKLWDTETWKMKRTLTGHSDWVISVAFSPNGVTLATGSLDHTIKLWNAETGELTRTLTEHTNSASIAFSAEGKMFASGSGDYKVILWDAQAWKPIRTLKGPEPTLWSIAFSPDGNTLAIASCNFDKAVRLWDVHTGELKRTLTSRTLFPESVAFSPDGNTVACGSNDFSTGKLVGGERYSTVVLWDAKTGDLKRTLKAHTDRVTSVAFSPDGKILASGSYDGTVRLWNSSEPK